MGPGLKVATMLLDAVRWGQGLRTGHNGAVPKVCNPHTSPGKTMKWIVPARLHSV